MIDLRSDTVTRPTPAMRRAMAEAEVGDDVYGEDPTVRRLEERLADWAGFAAGLFVPTGSMGNQLAIKLHARPGTEVVVEARSHVYNFELAAFAAIAGVSPRVVATADGLLDADGVRQALRLEAPYYVAPTSLIVLENTHNMAGGRILPPEKQRDITRLARQHRLPVHLDGARLWHAAVALDLPLRSLCEGIDSAMLCLSKGLGAPAGSVLLGSADFIREARVWRKRLGGGMRQVGVLAAACLVALDESIPRLVEDHQHARLLAEALTAIDGVFVSPVETNIVIAGLAGTGRAASEVVQALRAQGIQALAIDEATLRFVTHYDVCLAEVEQVIRVLNDVLA